MAARLEANREAPAVKPEWGAKRICQSCAAPFYDMRRSPILCPKCGAEFDPELLVKARRSRPPPVEEKEKEKAKKAPPPKTNDDLEAEEAPEDEFEDVDEEGAEDEDVIEDASELGEDDPVVSKVEKSDDDGS